VSWPRPRRLRLQPHAGAQAVQLFDTWAGELSPAAYEEFALPYQAAIVRSIRSAGVPAILFVNGCAGKLDLIAKCGADVVSVDWRVDLREARGDRRSGAKALGEAVADFVPQGRLGLGQLGQGKADVNQHPLTGHGRIVGQQADVDKPADAAHVHLGQIGLLRMQLDHLTGYAEAHLAPPVPRAADRG